MNDQVTALARSPIHRSLSQPSLLLGADRELVLLTGLAATISAFVVLTWFSILFAVLLWSLVYGLLRVMAKADPLMRQVYLRHVSYRSHYRPTASPWRRF